MEKLPITDQTKITRLSKRGDYNIDTIYSILDEALICTLAYSLNNQPRQIPTIHCRIQNKLYIHGSVGSFYLRELIEHQLPVCIGVTLLDGLVLAKSAFHHSMNYRSVVMFSKAEEVTSTEEQYRVLENLTNKLVPGRWADVRQPNATEWKATKVMSFAINEASAKIRTGPPIDDEEDVSLDIWSGVIPIQLVRGEAIRS